MNTVFLYKKSCLNNFSFGRRKEKFENSEYVKLY